MPAVNVFVAGSRRISRLPVEVKKRIDAMIDREFQILVGDAAGVDRAVQGYLADRAYRNVVVHCMEQNCRNNVGHWPARRVAAPPGTKGFERVPGLADLPVIFISAYGRDETVVRALEAGAADYIVKPFSATELTARIRAALRRRADPDPFVLGALAIHYDERRVSVAGRPVELTVSEYEVLRVLSHNAGRVVAYSPLIRQVSGKRYDRGAKVALRAVVKNLRRKLGDIASDPSYILTERGVGYRMPKPSGP